LRRAKITSALLALAAALCAAAGLLAPAAAAGTAAATGTAAAPAVGRELSGVSCRTARNCLAVGYDVETGGPLAEAWNGARWRTVSVKLPPGWVAGTLSGVSCAAVARCVAVGFYDKGGREFALADTWNGTAWTLALPPAPVGADTGLDAVSCTSAARCVAVGWYHLSGPHSYTPLAEIWNGKKWTQIRPPGSGRGFAVGALNAVSCTSAARCLAVGVPLGVQGVAVIEWWNGKAWTAGKGAPVPAGLEATQYGVSCSSAGSCVAVGIGTYATSTRSWNVGFSGIWDGKSWRYATMPASGGEALSVSCATAARCVAVGAAESADTQRATALTWNGRTWAVTGVAAPGKGQASQFTDVTCLSAASCVAVGQAGPLGSPNTTGLTGFWNGKTWRLVTA
jgi:hypothetical protein